MASKLSLPRKSVPQMSGRSITVSAPGKIHLLGEHAVVYGKPAILTAVGLRVKVTVSQGKTVLPELKKLRKIIDRIVKKELKLKTIPQYSLEISSQIPIRAGLGSSAAVSAAYIAALLTYLRVGWNLGLINKLAYEAEKVFHGNPSSGDNSTVVYGGLIWFRKEDPTLKLIQPLEFTIPSKLSKNFVIINTGKPPESTKEMIEVVEAVADKKPRLIYKFLADQERLVKQLLNTLREANEKELIRITREGEKNLESIGVVSKLVQPIIRQVEKMGGAAKICGAGGKTGPTGVLLCYHPTPSKLIQIAKSYNLEYFKTTLGTAGLKNETH